MAIVVTSNRNNVCRDCQGPVKKGEKILYDNGQAWHFPACPPKPVEPLVKKPGDKP